jgi:hypothetical protein
VLLPDVPVRRGNPFCLSPPITEDDPWAASAEEAVPRWDVVFLPDLTRPVSVLPIASDEICFESRRRPFVIEERDDDSGEEDVWETLAVVEDGMRRADGIQVDRATGAVRCGLCSIAFGNVGEFLTHCWEMH